MTISRFVCHRADWGVEIVPVTSDEADRVLASLKIQELESLLDEIKMTRKAGFIEEPTWLAEPITQKRPATVLV